MEGPLCGPSRAWANVTAMGWVRRSAVTLALALGAVLATSVPGPSGAGVGPAAPVAAARSGCGSYRPSGSTTLAFTVAGRLRTVVVHVPTAYTGTLPVPLVLNLHGTASTASAQEALSGMDATSDAHGFLVAYPQGFIHSGSGYDWNIPGQPLFGGLKVPQGAPNDVKFLTGLVSLLSQRYCVEATHVDATGFSGGARMASQLACDASSVFAAVGPVSGLRHPTPCPATRPVPVIAFHGTVDAIDPYEGKGQAYWTYSVGEAADRWAHQDGCDSPGNQSNATGFELEQFAACAGGSAVELYTLVGEGHEWPGGPRLPKKLTRLLGPQTFAVDANELMWSFFEAHPRP